MFWLFLFFVCGVLNFYFYFSKKLIALLMLELCFLSLIFFYYFFFQNTIGSVGFFSMMCFLGFMVMDSVLGLCMLILSSRNSSSFMDSFFGC